MALLAVRTGYDDFVGLCFYRPLRDDNVAGKRHDIALHIQRLLVGRNVDRLLGISGECQCRNTDGKKRAGDQDAV
ncbi:hypothetical protein OS31_24650 [Dickeya oryzae]